MRKTLLGKTFILMLIVLLFIPTNMLSVIAAEQSVVQEREEQQEAQVEIVPLEEQQEDQQEDQQEAQHEDQQEIAQLEQQLEAEQEEEEPAIAILQPESQWKASVFGDVGGQDKITTTNFSIVEHENGSIDMKSLNDRGKISSTTDGIAYIYQTIDQNQDFELTTTATINAIADHNQASFGIMVRNSVYEYVHDSALAKDDYLAVGALDKKMKLFDRQNGAITKQDVESAPLPLAGESFELSIKKSGNIYKVQINESTVFVDHYESDITYVGLFTARNADVSYTDIQLTVVAEEQPQLGELQFYAFGSNTSEEKNADPIVEEDKYILEATGGKVASSDEGISYLAYELPAQANFKLQATATVQSFNENGSISTPNQKSFGLMIRDRVAEHRSTSSTTANYVAVGALDQVMKGFYKQGVNDGASGAQSKLSAFNATAPAANEQYELFIEKSGNSYAVSVNGEAQIIESVELTSEQLFAGVYVARDAKIEFSNIELTIASVSVEQLLVQSDQVKVDYRLHEELDLTGLVVIAQMSNGEEYELTPDDYFVTGFDSSTLGEKVLSIHYRGKVAELQYEVKALLVTSMEIIYEPVITNYYAGDELNLQGLTVEATYEEGYLVAELSPDDYGIIIEGKQYNGYGLNEINEKHVFTSAAQIEVTIVASNNPDAIVSFQVTVADATLTDIEITKQPAKTVYFVGDELNLDGLVAYASYSDKTKKRLDKDELTISAFDSNQVGEQQLTLSYRNQSTTLTLTVKEKEPVSLVITSYPKTTYALGEALDMSELQLAIAYDNGDLQAITSSDYQLSTSAYDADRAGQYALTITASSVQLPVLELIVNVRESEELNWNSIRFGQSTSNANNTIEIDEEGVVTLKAIGGSAGKVTGDHDGISFYYVELDALEDNFELSADIKVIEYAKSPDHDGQESFGIMARDAIGAANDSSVFASNIAAIGGYSGGTRNANGTQLFVRTGIESPDGSGSQGIQAMMIQQERPTLQNTYPEKPYRLKLTKTNSGFVGQLNDNEPVMIYTDHIMQVQDNKMYVGFYTARLATIEVSNIELKVTSAASDAPKVDPPVEPLEPKVDMVSLLETSSKDAYAVKLKANSSGIVTIKQGNQLIAKDAAIEASSLFSVSSSLVSGINRFTIQFVPDETQNLTSYEPIILNRTVTVKQYEGDIYVSPEGTAGGEGTITSPLDLDTAIQYVAPGQTIVVLDGHYKRTSKLEIKKYNDGTADAMKTIKAAEGARPVIDFDKKSEGVVLSGNYWHFIGLDFARSANNTKGFTVGGSHNIIELVNLYEHGDTGLQISRTDQSNHIDDWPSYNLILNSTSYANRDPSNNNADGFAAKLTSGVGNVFRGAIAHHNVDDGWDLYTKAGSGAIGAVIIEDSIAYNNGYLLGGTELLGDGNGFKLGGEGIHVPHMIRNSIAFNNGTAGFTSNSNPGVIATNNIGFNNGKGNIVFTTYGHITPDFTINGFVSYATEAIPKDQVPASSLKNSNYFNDGSTFANRSGVKLTDRNFKSLDVPSQFERDAEGNIILGDFLAFIAPKAAQDSNTDQPSPVVEETNPTTELTLRGEAINGVVDVTLSPEQVTSVLAAIEQASDKMIAITVNSQIPGTSDSYRLTLPSALFANGQLAYDVKMTTPVGELTLPHQLLADLTSNGSGVTIHIEAIDDEDKSASWNNDGIARPVVSFTLSWNNETIHLDGSVHPLTLFIPYVPQSYDSQHLNKLTVWYIDADGETSPIPNAYYDHKARGMVWTTTHLSKYAIVLKDKQFADVSEQHWAYDAINTLAARGIVQGTDQQHFAPGQTVTRADYLLMLIRALGLTADTELAAGFFDVPSDFYAAKEIAIGQQLGIVSGYSSGEFNPRAQISRQEMFVMTYRALQLVEQLQIEPALNDEVLLQFADAHTIDAYASMSVASLIEAGLIKGSQDQINGQGLTTRAEAAVLIERLLSARND